MAELFDKFKTWISGGEEEDYDDDEEYENDGSYDERDEEPATPAKRSSNKVASFDNYPRRTTHNTRVLNINTKMEVVISNPTNLEEAGEVCEDLKAKKTTVVNLENVEYEMSQRISDFLCGACYALEGSIQLVSDRIFIIGPVNVDITGEFKDELKASGIKLPTSMWK